MTEFLDNDLTVDCAFFAPVQRCFFIEDIEFFPGSPAASITRLRVFSRCTALTVKDILPAGSLVQGFEEGWKSPRSVLGAC